MFKVCVIGSVSQEDDIKNVAEWYKDVKGCDVWYVERISHIPLPQLIQYCFEKIANCDLVVAVSKPDNTYGTGTTYEIEFANFIGKNVKKLYIQNIIR